MEDYTEIENTETSESNETTPFAVELAKAFALSAAAVAGTFAGMALIGGAYNKLQDVKDAREARRNAKKEAKEIVKED